MSRLYKLFENAPTIGSLIDPHTDSDLPLLEATYAELEPLLVRALQVECDKRDYIKSELGIAAQGIATAAKLLAGCYHLVVTNVPYLAGRRHDDILKNFCESHYPKAKTDLATVFVERCQSLCYVGGSLVLVTPQNWLFLGSYKKLRKHLLQDQTWNLVVRLGPRAFDTISGEVVNVILLLLTCAKPSKDHTIYGLEASTPRNATEKASYLYTEKKLQQVSQSSQLLNPDTRVALDETSNETLLERYADAYAGIRTGDYPRFGRCFWELPSLLGGWVFQHSTTKNTLSYGGLEHLLFWEEGKGQLAVYQALLAASCYASVRSRLRCVMIQPLWTVFMPIFLGGMSLRCQRLYSQTTLVWSAISFLNV